MPRGNYRQTTPKNKTCNNPVIISLFWSHTPCCHLLKCCVSAENSNELYQLLLLRDINIQNETKVYSQNGRKWCCIKWVLVPELPNLHITLWILNCHKLLKSPLLFLVWRKAELCSGFDPHLLFRGSCSRGTVLAKSLEIWYGCTQRDGATH